MPCRLELRSGIAGHGRQAASVASVIAAPTSTEAQIYRSVCRAPCGRELRCLISDP